MNTNYILVIKYQEMTKDQELKPKKDHNNDENKEENRGRKGNVGAIKLIQKVKKTIKTETNHAQIPVIKGPWSPDEHKVFLECKRIFIYSLSSVQEILGKIHESDS